MPKLWTETIDMHRSAVRAAALDAAASLVGQCGLASVTMSGIAKATGIGRATLYKYFPDVGAILMAWHERQVTAHIAQLAAIRDRSGSPIVRLEAVLQAFAAINHKHHGAELAASLHSGRHVARAQLQLNSFVRDLLIEGVASGDIRDDVAPNELAGFCLHALGAAGSLPSAAAVRRLVGVTMAGLRPQSLT